MDTSVRLQRDIRNSLVLILSTLIACLVFSCLLMASRTHAAQQAKDTQHLQLVLGKSTIVDVPVPIKRASLANPDIADAIVLSPRQIYVTGKGYGTTNLTLWSKDDQVLTIFDLEVGIDLTRLESQLVALLPDEGHIEVSASHDHVTLAGTVSSPAKLSQAVAVAEAYAPKKVLNFLRVYPDPVGENPPPEAAPVTVEVIRGTSVNSQKF
ncbi:MAG: pilus assembly protein N-terminal domain-containing protein [Nitrospiraceae bacterium]